jgi:hypothetical protein
MFEVDAIMVHHEAQGARGRCSAEMLQPEAPKTWRYMFLYLPLTIVHDHGTTAGRGIRPGWTAAST